MSRLWNDTAALKMLLHAPHLAAFFDFDGTLVPFAPTPDAIKVPQRVIRLLDGLAQQGGRVAGIISGRSVRDLEGHLGNLSPRVMLAGNHGLEWKIGGTYGTVPLPDGYRESLQAACRALVRYAEQVPGLTIEWKDLTVSAHLRLVDDRQRGDVRKHIWSLINAHNPAGVLAVLNGAYDVDIRPNMHWSKAEVVRYFLHEGFVDVDSLPLLYVGDDTTDEDVFESFPHAVTVHVGESNASHAKYVLGSVSEVWALLASLSTGVLHH